MSKIYTVLGIMSGTSLDGVDLACCRFTFREGSWRYRIVCTETIPYAPAWKQRLASVESGSALELAFMDAEYGHLLGTLARRFIQKHRIQPQLIASHGHTIFHQPGRGMTLQIGSGAAIAAETGITVICDFRTTDVALGGQGAPLVPAGDRLLFSTYTCCLNLGGFANLSYERGNRRIAFDICPVNIVLNMLASQTGKEFDEGGRIAAGGKLHPDLLAELNSLPFYSQKPPKSLGKEWVLSEFMPVLDRCRIPLTDKLNTVCTHAAVQIGMAARPAGKGTMLVTGGGAFNDFLVGQIGRHSLQKPVVPDYLTVSFKEALIFAFLGVLRITGRTNTLRSVTGASSDSAGGAVYAPVP